MENFFKETFVLVSVTEHILIIGETKNEIRIELFSSIDNRNKFRARIWHLESFRLVPTPTLSINGIFVSDEPSDEDILVERTWQISDEILNFYATSDSEAKKHVEIAINNYVKSLFSK